VGTFVLNTAVGLAGFVLALLVEPEQVGVR
jgi:hypothetical protein